MAAKSPPPEGTPSCSHQGTPSCSRAATPPRMLPWPHPTGWYGHGVHGEQKGEQRAQVGPGVTPWALSGRPDLMMAGRQVAPAMMQIPAMGFTGQYMIAPMRMMAPQIVPVGGQQHPSQHASQFVAMQRLAPMAPTAPAMSSAGSNNGNKAPQASAVPVGNGSMISWGSTTNSEGTRACDRQSLSAPQGGAMAAATGPQLTPTQFQQAFSFSSVPAQTYQLAPTAQLPLNVDLTPRMEQTSASTVQPASSSSGPLGLASLALAGEVLQGDSPAPRPRKTEVPVARLRKVLLFIQQMGRRPTRKSRGPAEKTLGIWLHRFTCNDDGVKDRAQNSMPPHEFDFIMQTIESAPDAKQVGTPPPQPARLPVPPLLCSSPVLAQLPAGIPPARVPSPTPSMPPTTLIPPRPIWVDPRLAHAGGRQAGRAQ